MTIDDFIKAEEIKMSWLDKLVMNYPKARPTKSLSDPLASLTCGVEELIAPSIWDKFVSLIILFFLGLVWIGLLRAILNYQFPFIIFLVGFLFVTFIAIVL